MGNRAASDSIKSAATALYTAMKSTPGGWASAVVLNEDGTPNVEESKRAINRALSMHLRDVGALKTGGFARTSSPVNATNVFLGIFFSFSKLAKGDPKGAVALMPLIYTVIQDMAVAVEDIDRAKRIIREVLDRADSPFAVETGARKFDGAKVSLKAPPATLVPAPFRPWAESFGDAPAPVAAPAPAPVPAPASKGKGKGK